MSQEKPVIHKGLEGIYVCESSISVIYGDVGKLYYRGYSIEDLAEHSCYEEVTYLLLYGKLPTRRELDDFKKTLVENRDLPDVVLDFLKKVPKNAHPMEVLRSAVSMLGHWDPEPEDNSLEALGRKAIRITAKMPCIVAAFNRFREGKEYVPPNPNLGHAANFLYMLNGKEPDEFEAKTMDVCLILYAEHGMNASAFAAIVTAATLSDMYSAIVSGIGTLRGPLHGGANEMAMREFMKVGDPSKAEEYVLEKLRKKERIMGFGHRVYKAYDPRAKIFRRYAEEMAKRKGGEIKKLYDIALKMEEVAIRELGAKKILTNVDYWMGIPAYALGIPIDLYTPIFAISRVAGWSAHVLEYVAQNRLIRPRQYYVGPIDLEYVPIDKRG